MGQWKDNGNYYSLTFITDSYKMTFLFNVGQKLSCTKLLNEERAAWAKGHHCTVVHRVHDVDKCEDYYVVHEYYDTDYQPLGEKRIVSAVKLETEYIVFAGFQNVKHEDSLEERAYKNYLNSFTVISLKNEGVPEELANEFLNFDISWSLSKDKEIRKSGKNKEKHLVERLSKFNFDAVPIIEFLVKRYKKMNTL